MSEYQDWVLTEECTTGFEILDLVMDHPDCWYYPANEYPALLPCLSE